MDSVLVIGGHSGVGEATVNRLGMMPLIPYVPYHDDVDVTKMDRMWQYVKDYGPFENIVYSAGVNTLAWTRNMWRGAILEDTFAVNVKGFVDLISIHVDIWPGTKVSAVAVSSDAAELPMRGSLAYCVSKAALNMAIKVMARELAPLWRVNGVAPGMVEGTPMTEYIDRTIPGFRGWSPEYAKMYERSSVPTARRATLEEVAEVICFVLTGPDQINGEIIRINGGKT